jgi:hypothetical protein
MQIEDIINQLPNHWEMWSSEEASGWDDHYRDANKPGFIRKDRLARIYFHNTLDIFGIEFDYHNDGYFKQTLKLAITYADNYINQYPLEFHVCQVCQCKATWYYVPASEMFLDDKFYCAEHVPRGCSCNLNSNGTEDLDDDGTTLRQLPCIEYEFNNFGFPKEL